MTDLDLARRAVACKRTRTQAGKFDSEGPERFLSKLVPGGVGGTCLEWTGYATQKGYGRTYFHGKRKMSHHVAWFISTGEWPTQLLLHSCDNPACCNVEHLRNGTAKENTADMFARGRDKRINGERVCTAKLTENSVRDIRKMHESGVRAPSLARLFGIDRSYIWRILRRKAWKHI